MNPEEETETHHAWREWLQYQLGAHWLSWNYPEKPAPILEKIRGTGGKAA
jgi:hypothetical protein